MFKLKADPTFWARVEIPRPGAEPMLLDVEYRHHGRKALAELHTRMEGRSKLDLVRELVIDWKADAPFTKEALADLDDEYLGAADALIERYFEELTGASRKN